MDDKSAQDDEILAIKSIYEEDEIFTFDENKKLGSICVKIESTSESSPFIVNFLQEKAQVKIQYLTPIIIEFELPTDYPSVNPPNFKLYCRWLNIENISKLCKKLDELWDQNLNIPILFTWISFLSNELFDYLNIKTDNVIVSNDEKQENFDKRANKQTCSSNLLENYNSDQIELKFQKCYFPCNICFSEKSGKVCLKFSKCEHVFCNECLKGYFETLIADGNVKKMTCPQDKCESQATPAQVLSLVGIEKFNRYDSILLKDALNDMLDIVYCPRVDCQCAVIPEDTTLARCPDCKNVFCALCRKGYHGIEPCKITSRQLKEICSSYLNGDKETRDKLILKYGEKRIKQAIEENSSMELIEKTSKQCPSCRSWMQKLDGCNKMTCSKCHAYFCWLCLKVLSKSDPYSHFNNQRSDCFEKLFEGVVNVRNFNDDDDEESDGENEFNLVFDDEDDDDDDDDDDEDDDEDE